jgi:hypothetical protein
MKNRNELGRRSSRSREGGFAYLIVLFAILFLLIISTAAVQHLSIEGRRMREEETIWRGRQYTRAIKMYYHKTGHYPQDLKDLEKGLPQLHFLRQAYKNPINKDDGTWRFIYVNAAGQIIGSTRYASMQQMALVESGALQNLQPGQNPNLPGISAASLANPSNNLQGISGPSGPPGSGSAPPGATSPDSSQNPPADQSGANSQNPQQPQTTQPTQNPPQTNQGTFGQIGSLGFSSGTSTNGTSSSSSDQQLQNPILSQKPTGPVDGPVLGGFLVGVGGTNDAASLKVYHGGKKYKDWEFIWNPLLEQALAMNQAVGQATSLPGAIGLPIANPFGGSTGNPFGQNPQQPQNPQQSQPQHPQNPMQPMPQQ